MSFLTEPSPMYKTSFLEGLREFQKEGRLLQYDVQRVATNFEHFIQRVLAQKDTVKTYPGQVPQVDFWLIDEDKYIGLLSVRLAMNDFLLRIGGNIGYQIRPSQRRQGYGREILHLGLQKARELGVERVLVTCDEDNIGSKKVIEYNGGKFENMIDVEGSPVKKLRYWIDL